MKKLGWYKIVTRPISLTLVQEPVGIPQNTNITGTGLKTGIGSRAALLQILSILHSQMFVFCDAKITLHYKLSWLKGLPMLPAHKASWTGDASFKITPVDLNKRVFSLALETRRVHNNAWSPAH